MANTADIDIAVMSAEQGKDQHGGRPRDEMTDMSSH